MAKKLKITQKQCKLRLLKALLKVDPHERREILHEVSDTCIDDICEILYNLVYGGKIAMPQSKKKRIRSTLKKQEKAYRRILDKETPVKERRRVLKSQSGGSLAILLSAVVPILADLVFGKRQS